MGINKKILNEIIKNKDNPSKLSTIYIPWSKYKELDLYYERRIYIFKQPALDIIKEFNKLENLLVKFDYIGGKTNQDREFKLFYNKVKFKLQIFKDENSVYEPEICISDIFRNNILSYVNKIEKSYFYDGRTIYSNTKRKNIYIDGIYEELSFELLININNNSLSNNMNYNGKKYIFSYNNYYYIPNHIPYEQKHIWLYKYLLKKENIEESIYQFFKQNFVKCCGSTLNLMDRFCRKCGKKIIVENLEISNIKGEELLNLLT